MLNGASPILSHQGLLLETKKIKSVIGQIKERVFEHHFKSS